MTVTIKKDRVADVLKQVKALTSRQVLVGVPAEHSGRNPEPGEDRAINNAEIGYIMEFGAPERNIPERPFLLPGVRGEMDKITARMKTGAEKALSGDKDAADRTLNAVGLMAQNAVRAKINEGVPPPLSPRTLEERRARGRTGEKPLIDTGQLRNSVTYVIRKGR